MLCDVGGKAAAFAAYLQPVFFDVRPEVLCELRTADFCPAAAPRPQLWSHAAAQTHKVPQRQPRCPSFQSSYRAHPVGQPERLGEAVARPALAAALFLAAAFAFSSPRRAALVLAACAAFPLAGFCRRPASCVGTRASVLSVTECLFLSRSSTAHA
jgi:hypothetical protein